MDLYERIRKIAVANGTNIAQIEKSLSLARGSMRKWKVSTPSAQKLQTIADYLNVSVEQLLGTDEIDYEPSTHTWEESDNVDSSQPNGYYLYEQTREITDFLMHNPEYSVLFDASRKVKPEDIRKAIKMLGILSED